MTSWRNFSVFSLIIFLQGANDLAPVEEVVKLITKQWGDVGSTEDVSLCDALLFSPSG
jgi:hypothetical protein